MAKAKKDDRAVIYDKIQVNLLSGENALTAETAKEILGWEVATDGEYTLIDETGAKVRCVNNAKNRPFNEGWARTLCQDILQKRWAGPNGNGLTVNGETVIVGRTGLVLSAQHRLIGLVLASQLWAGDQGDHWKKVWLTEPVLDTVMVCGVDESDENTMTLDNVKPRSLADVLYVGGYFNKLKSADRKTVCRMLDHATRLLWSRTRQDTHAFSPRRTHSEALDFIGRHPKLVDAVKHVFEENGGSADKIKRFLSLGYAAGMLYLMGVSGTHDEKATKYKRADEPSEKMLDKSLWDKACEFWVMVASTSPDLKHFRAVYDVESSFPEKFAVLAKAWGLWTTGGALTPKNLTPKRNPDDDGVMRLAEHPVLGGIDFGPASEDDGSDRDETPLTVEPPEEEVEVKTDGETKSEPKKSPAPKAKSAPSKNGAPKPETEPAVAGN